MHDSLIRHKAMIPELQSAEHFEPINLWEAARIFPIYASDRFEQAREDGAISVAAARRAQAESAKFWGEQLLQSVGKDRIEGHPYRDGFIYTSNFPGCKGYADWCVLLFEMSQCLQRIPPQEADFDYADFKFVSSRLSLALPAQHRKNRPIYDPSLADFEYEDFLREHFLENQPPLGR